MAREARSRIRFIARTAWQPRRGLWDDCRVTNPDRNPAAPRRTSSPRGSAGIGPGLTPAIVLVALLQAATAPRAAVIRVPEDHPTLRSAVGAAGHRDTILIAPGVHQGGVFVDRKSLTLASRFLGTGDTALVSRTVLSGVQADMCAGLPGCSGGAVLEFGAAAHGSAVIGLTVTDGEDGIRSQAMVDITSCHIVGNGDGVDFVSGSGGTFQSSLFARNRDDGIDLNGRIQARIIGNDIRENRQDGVEYRLHAYRGPTQTIEFIGNRIVGNKSDGIQLIDYPDVSSRVIRIEGNHFSANGDAAVGCLPDGRTIEDFGGAAVAERVLLIGNTFIGERHGMVGGANVVVLNNIFTGIRVSALRRVAGGSVASSNLFWKNGTDFDDCAFEPSLVLKADPRLDGSGRPAAGSPAIDTGLARFVSRGDTLLDIPPAGYLGRAPDLGAVEAGRVGRSSPAAARSN
jgi:parallel beta helix pectate lyase-like protein